MIIKNYKDLNSDKITGSYQLRISAIGELECLRINSRRQNQNQNGMI